MGKKIDFWDLLSDAQAFIAQNYSASLNEDEADEQIKAYIKKYLYDSTFEVEDYSQEKLIDRLYC